MKQGPFLQLIADVLNQPVGSVKLYARELREAGLLTTGARGVNAPHMTPMDAARLVLGILATNKPTECVERVRRFGPIPYNPSYSSICTWRETVLPDEFKRTFEGETAEDVLAGMFGMFDRLGINEACKWFNNNVFHLKVLEFEVRIELTSWKIVDGVAIAERIVPFQGEVMVKNTDGEFRHVEGFTPINAGRRTTTSMLTGGFVTIGLALMQGDNKDEDQ